VASYNYSALKRQSLQAAPLGWWCSAISTRACNSACEHQLCQFTALQHGQNAQPRHHSQAGLAAQAGVARGAQCIS
jgi:hypothetical protein